MVGLDDLKGVFQPCGFYDSMIKCALESEAAPYSSPPQHSEGSV